MLGERKRKGSEFSRQVFELGRMPVSAKEGSTSERVLDEVELEEALEVAAEEVEDAEEDDPEEIDWRRNRRRAADCTWK